MVRVFTHWNFDNLWVKNLLFRHVAFEGLHSGAVMNNAFGHYSIIKTAKELGCRSCLIMEDDIRFLRDLLLLKEVVRSLPADYDVAMFDSLIGMPGRFGVPSGRPINKYWSLLHGNLRACSAACYALGEKGMERFISLYEKPVHEFGTGAVRQSDWYFDMDHCAGLKLYVSYPKAARQVRIAGSMPNTNYDSWSQCYGLCGSYREKYGV